MWMFGRKGESGFSASSTAEQVTHGIDANGLTAIVTGVHVFGSNCETLESDRLWTICTGVGPKSLSRQWLATTQKNNFLDVLYELMNKGLLLSGYLINFSGASSGIGAETARVLAMRGVHVVMAVRNVKNGTEVKENILKEVPHANIDVMELDLASMASVRKFASDYNSSGYPLNILINNAGAISPSFMLSQDNIELLFATNHLGHFLLTNLLLPNLKKSAQESHKEGRIVNVSSMGHRFTYREGIRFDKINDKDSYSNMVAYGQSKLANILHANELARHFKEEGLELTANSLHPGVINTNLLRHQSFMEGVVNWIGKYFFKNIPQGAATTCYVALHPNVKGISGEYFSDSNIAKPTSQARDAELAKKLWDFSFKLAELQ